MDLASSLDVVDKFGYLSKILVHWLFKSVMKIGI